jgi:hypothetical protein
VPCNNNFYLRPVQLSGSEFTLISVSYKIKFYFKFCYPNDLKYFLQSTRISYSSGQQHIMKT